MGCLIRGSLLCGAPCEFGVGAFHTACVGHTPRTPKGVVSREPGLRCTVLSLVGTERALGVCPWPARAAGACALARSSITAANTAANTAITKSAQIGRGLGSRPRSGACSSRRGAPMLCTAVRLILCTRAPHAPHLRPCLLQPCPP